jgi:hypothetical protein
VSVDYVLFCKLEHNATTLKFVKYKYYVRQYTLKEGERSRVRGKKYVLMLTLTFLLGTIIPYIPPAKSDSTVKFYVEPEFPGYVPQNTTGIHIWLNVYIESPIEWYNTNTSDGHGGIVGWAMNIKVNETVLEPIGVYGATFGYWLFDFADSEYGGSTTVLGDVQAENGTFYEFSEQIWSFNSTPIFSHGAGGNGLLCKLRYKVLPANAYTRIDLGYPAPGSLYMTAYYFIGFERYEVDVIIDGHYTQPPFTYMHSAGSMIDISAPVGTSWHELYPTYCTPYEIDDWTDTNDDGNLTACDFIQLNDTSWYHVEDVTLTIQTRNNSETTAEVGLYNASYTDVLVAGWNNPAYAYEPNTTYADTTTDEAAQIYGNYGINIPGSAEVTKVEVGYKAYTATDEHIWFIVSWDGNATWSGYIKVTDITKSDPGVLWLDFTGKIPGDIWYPQNLTDANFRVQAEANQAGGGAMGAVYLDWIPVRVSYNLGKPTYLDFEGGDSSSPARVMRQAIANPVNFSWYEVYPSFGLNYNISDWIDTDNSEDLSVCDWFTWNGTLWHVEDLDTDIIIRGPVEEWPEFPLGLALEIGLIVAVAYVWWRSRRKTKITRITKQEKLAY